MEADKIPKWRKQVEAILREKFPGDDFPQLLKKAFELVDLLGDVELPSGEIGKVVAPILKAASEELHPLAGVYAAFQLGVAYERYQNANST